MDRMLGWQRAATSKPGFVWLLVGLCALATGACSGSKGAPKRGGGADAADQASDSPADAGADSPVEAAPDAPSETAADSSSDGSPDASADGALDGAADSNPCEAGFASCGNGCIDVSSDPANCGACGHDCQGGACQAGRCQSVDLADNPITGVGLIAVDNTNVYWTFSGGIEKCAKTGCNKLSTELAGSQVPNSIGLDATDVYWTNSVGGTAMKCAKSGCSSPTQLVNWNPLALIAVGSTNIYFAESQVVIDKCSKSGCSAPTPLATNQGSVSGVAVDANKVYWTDSTGGTVMSCAVGGCGGNPTQLVSGQSGPKQIALDSTNVYWANDTIPFTIMKCAKAGCNGSPTQIASDTTWAQGLAADGASVFWTDYNGNVLECAIGGCNKPTTVASGANHAYGIAVDATSVYWTDGTSVFKVAKP